MRDEVKRLSRRPETRVRAWPEEVHVEQGVKKKARTKKETGDTSVPDTLMRYVQFHTRYKYG